MVLFTITLLLLTGCGGGVSDLAQYTEEVKNRPPGEAPPLPEMWKPPLSPRQLGPDPFAPLH
jgi:Tfp pilus assembly protein PilP